MGKPSGPAVPEHFAKEAERRSKHGSGDGRSPADGQAARRRSEGRRVASFAPPQVSELGGERASTRLNSPDLLATIWIRVEDEFTIRTGVFQVIDFAQGRDAYALGSFGTAIFMQPPWPLRFQQSLANNRRKVMRLLIASIAALAIASPALAQNTPPASNDTMANQSTSTTTTTTTSPTTKTVKKHKIVRHHKPVKHRKHHRVRHTHTTKVKAHVTSSSTTKS
jgi:hypothetical protein